MRPVRVLGVYLLVVFVGGALLAPWIYGLVHSAAGAFPALQTIAAKPFPRYVNRALLILALAGLLPFLQACGLNSWRALGLERRPGTGFQVAFGFAFGLASLAVLVLLALGAGARQFTVHLTVARLLTQVVKAAATAVSVAVLEELIFRGALFGTLRKTFHWSMALVISSGIYALLHFLERPDWAGLVRWNSGLLVLGGMVAGFGDVHKLLPGFVNLTLAGMILALGFQKTGSLWFSIGLHAGWIFWLKTYAALTQETTSEWIWLFGTGKLINGWLASAVLVASYVILNRLILQENAQTGWRERRMFS